MATGKKAKDIFARTVDPADIGLEVAPRIKGRPQAPEPYKKITVCLYDRQVLFLDKVALAIRERTGKQVKRAELIRAIVDKTAEGIRPDMTAAAFDKAVQALLTEPKE